MFMKLLRALALTVSIVCVFGIPGTLLAECDQPDAPDCACFVDTAIWDAGGPSAPGTLWIQDVARDALISANEFIMESCNCPPTAGCTWDPEPTNDEVDFRDAGKPYYNIVLGLNSEALALWTAELMDTVPDMDFRDREPWCSEAVSYWHRETSIPYLYGYRTDWWENWVVAGVADLRTWYETEEESGGRGRWIEATEVSYEGFELGVNVPVPGAYVAVAEYVDPPGEYPDMKVSHSLIVDEMWVHRDAYGEVFQVEVSLLEGNAGNEVRDSRHWDDILSLTPMGSQWVSHWRGDDNQWGTADDIFRKIYGFGIDLDSDGQPIHDPARLHYEDHPFLRSAYAPATTSVQDWDWEKYSAVLPDLILYATLLEDTGGPLVRWEHGKEDPIPDGQQVHALDLPVNFMGEIIIDLMAPHPLPIEGLELTWAPGPLPLGYTVEFFRDGEYAWEAFVPDLSPITPMEGQPITVPILLDDPLDGVRRVKLLFPEGSVPEPATLQDLSFRYEGAPWDDAAGESVEVERPLFVDVKPGSCPNPVNPKGGGVVPVAILGSARFDVTTIDPASVTIGDEEIAPLRWSYRDVATPFLGASEDCHRLREDGFLDLTLKFDARELIEGLNLGERVGETVVLPVRGNLTEEAGGAPILGQDWVKVLKN